MSFSERAKTIALAIVKIFETSKPFGNYSAVAVLDDGAGISYGVSQFTHKSGGLFAVLKRFHENGGQLPKVIHTVWDDIDFPNNRNIKQLSQNDAVKAALRKLGKDPLMQKVQREIAFENYLRPALQASEGSNFTQPLSLAVIYDSKNHGSYEKIRDLVKIDPPGNGSMKPEQFEKAWITEYVRQRDAWLESIPRLKKTDYRTDFFAAQIGRGNWNLDLPMNVHGFKLTEEILFPSSTAEPQRDPQVVLQDAYQNKGEQSNAVQTPAEAPKPEESPKAEPPKVIKAPEKENATADSVKITIAGMVVPPLIVGLIKSIQELVEKGYLNAKEVGDTVVGFVFANTKYVLVLAGLVIFLMIAKKLFKQITLWIQMWIASDKDRIDVEVKPQ